VAAPITLRTAIAPYPHVRALRDGRVSSRRVRFAWEEVEPITRAFRGMARSLEFDLCEMAVTTLAQAIAWRKAVTGLSVVLMRGFHHGALVCPVGSRLTGPVELAGGRVGVRAWSQTTGVWVRGILQHEYAVEPGAITWITEEDAHVAEFTDPPIVARAAEPVLALFRAGRIDAGIALRGLGTGEARPVITDAGQAAAAWFGRTGIYPVNHALCVRRPLLDDYPWLAAELLALFAAARDAARPEPDPIAGEALPYGLQANRRSIEMLAGYAAEQELIPRAYAAEEIFAV
jgi:4,5-dihydroxyphthalate decarboxylase